MVVNQPMPRDRTLTGRKSWFFNGDQIVCLGSDITCDEAEYPTQTTLCQKGLETDDAGSFLPTPLDGGDFIEIPGERVLDAANPHWFIDVQRTGYYVPAGQPVTVTRRHQESRSSWDEEDTEGDFLTAWIDHGMAPSNASYEYMLVVRAAAEAMEKLASEPPYRILQQDRDAHIVHHKDTGRWACVFFASQDVAAHEADEQVLPVSSVDHPCLIMAEPGKGGRLDLSVADPDLNLVDDVNQPKALRVVLRGAWRLQKAKATVCQWELPDAPEDVRVLSSGAGETVLEIVCRHGASYDLTVTG
jgi:chondroitin-sulfate-ABC endolyase/exolyase